VSDAFTPDTRAAAGWLDPAVVARALGRPELETDPELAAAVAAVEAWVASVRADLDVEGTYVPTADVERGAVILTCDIYRRPATYGGSGTSLGDLGSFGMVPGVDPMVERLLGIGRFRRGGRLG